MRALPLPLVALVALLGCTSQRVAEDATSRPHWTSLPPLAATGLAKALPEETGSQPPAEGKAQEAQPEAAPARTTITLQDALSAPPAATPARFNLEQAINRALLANRGIGDAEDRLAGAGFSMTTAEAEFELKIVPGADVGLVGGGGADPTDDLGAGVALKKKFSTGTALVLEPKVRRRDERYAAGLEASISQPILRGFNIEHNLSGIHAAEYAERSARRSLYMTQVDTVMATVSGVYEAIRQRELVRLNEESSARLRGHAEAAHAKGKIGLASPIDVYRAKIQLKQAEDNLASARESYRDALDNLKIIMAVPLDRDVQIEAPLEFDRVAINEEAAVQVALESRVEVGAAEDALNEAVRRSRVAKHELLPEFNVVLGYSRFGREEDFGQLSHFDEDNWNIGFTTSTDLTRTEERAAYEQSLLTLKGANRGLSLRRDEVARQVKRELRNLRRAEKRISIQQEQIEQADGKLELARVKFSRGMADNFDVIEAEGELRQAQTNLLSAVTEYILGTYRLRAVMGTLLEKPSYW